MISRPTTFALAAALAAAVLFPAPAGAQDPGGKSKRVETLAERQEKARKEIERLQERLREIAEKLRKRGDEAQAKKLEEAFAKIQEIGLIPAMKQAALTLRDTRLWEAADQQKEVLSKIDKILDLLLDRKDFEEIKKAAEELAKQRENLRELIEREKSHIKEADRIAAESEKAVPEDLRKEAEQAQSLLDRQRALMRTTSEADVAEDVESVNRAIEKIDEITRNQQSLHEGVKEVRGLTSQEAEALEKALNRIDSALAEQTNAREAAASKGEAPDLEALSKAIEGIRSLQESLAGRNDEEIARSGKTGLDKTVAALEEAREKQRRLRYVTSAAGDVEAARKGQEEIQKRAGKDPELAAEHARIQGKAAEKMRETADNLAQALDAAGLSDEEWKSLKKASEAVQEASEDLRTASRTASEASAADSAKKAHESLAAAAKALAAVTGKEREKLSGAQKALASSVAGLAKEAAPPANPPEGADPAAAQQRQRASESLGTAASMMEKAAEEIGANKASDANASQSRAEGALSVALGQLKAILQKVTPETRNEAPEQRALAGKTDEASKALAGQAKNRPGGEDGKVGKSLSQASSSAAAAAGTQAEAARGLDRGDNLGASAAQKQAREELEKAAAELAKAIEAAKGREGREDLAAAEEKISGDSRSAAEGLDKVAETMKSRGASDRAGDLSGFSSALRKASEAAKGASEAARGAKSSEAAQKSAEAKEQLSKAAEGLRNFLKESKPVTENEARSQAELAKEAAEVSKSLGAIADRAGASSPQRSDLAHSASEHAQNAANRMAKASRDLQGGDPRNAENEQKRALQQLDEAKKAAEELMKRMLERNEPLRKELAERQEQLMKEAEDLARRMREKESGREPRREAAAESLKAASGQMQKSSESVVNRNFSKAKERQQDAVKALEEARRKIKELEDEALRQKMERELNALIREQEGTEEKTRLTEEELEKLSRLLEARKTGRAAEAMDQAKHKVSSMEIKPAREKMEEAREYLEQAERDVEEQERRYHQAAQEQLIFQIKTQLKEVLEEQKKIGGVLDELGTVTAGGARLNRSQVRRVLAAAASQDKLVARMQEIEKKIEEEAKVYAWVAASVAEDMMGIAELMRDQPPDLGPVTQGLQREVVSRVEELLKAFELELKQREDQQKPKKPQEGGGGRPRLVPPLAELQMLRTVQTQIKDNTDSVVKALGDKADLTPVQKMVLERLSHRQGNLNDVMRKFINSLTGEGAPGSRR